MLCPVFYICEGCSCKQDGSTGQYVVTSHLPLVRARLPFSAVSLQACQCQAIHFYFASMSCCGLLFNGCSALVACFKKFHQFSLIHQPPPVCRAISEPLLDVEPEHVEDHLHLPVEFTGIYLGFYETKQVFKSAFSDDIKAYS